MESFEKIVKFLENRNVNKPSLEMIEMFLLEKNKNYLRKREINIFVSIFDDYCMNDKKFTTCIF